MGVIGKGPSNHPPINTHATITDGTLNTELLHPALSSEGILVALQAFVTPCLALLWYSFAPKGTLHQHGERE